MKRLALLLAALVTAGACVTSQHFPGQPHWLSNQPDTITRRVVVKFDPVDITPDRITGVQHGVDAWNAAQSWVQFVLDVSPGECPDGELLYHCIDTEFVDYAGAYAQVGWNSAFHIHGNGCTIGFDYRNWGDQAAINNGWTHELGHCLGLNHPPDGGPGPSIGGFPTEWDVALVGQSHGHVDFRIFGTAIDEAPGGKTHKDTKAKLTRESRM